MPHFDDKTWAMIEAHDDTKLNPPTKPEMLAAFEAKYDVVLPEAHREFLLRANGGEIGCARLFGVGKRGALDLAYEIKQMRGELEETAAGPVLPFANDWGGSYFCYDLSKQATAKGYRSCSGTTNTPRNRTTSTCSGRNIPWTSWRSSRRSAKTKVVWVLTHTALALMQNVINTKDVHILNACTGTPHVG